MLRGLGIIGAFIAILIAAPASASSPPPDFFGVSAPFVYDGTDDERREKYMTRIARLGTGTVRLALSWEEVEPRPPQRRTHHYRWGLVDARVELLARHGQRAYPALNDAANWARAVGANRFGPPRPVYVPHYAAFAAEAARRYGPGGSFWGQHPDLPYLPVLSWEIWNEPNLRYFWGDTNPNPHRYAKLLAATLAAIRITQPQAGVVMGGLSATEKPKRYLRRVMRTEPTLRDELDYVGFHPYGGTAAGGLRRLAEFRAALDAHASSSISIEITEDGMTTRDDARRKRYLARMAASAAAWDCGVSRYIVHTWVTSERRPREAEHWYGIAERNGNLKPSGRAYRRAIAAAAVGRARASQSVSCRE